MTLPSTSRLSPSFAPAASSAVISATQSTEKKNTPVTQADSFQKTEALSAQARSGIDIKIPRYLLTEGLIAHNTLKPNFLELLLSNYYQEIVKNKLKLVESGFSNPSLVSCSKEYTPSIIVKKNQAEDMIIVHTHYKPIDMQSNYIEEAQNLFPQLLVLIDQSFLTAVKKIHKIDDDAIQFLAE